MPFTSIRDDLQELIDDADYAYLRYRRVVIETSDDGRPPPPSLMSAAQRSATVDLEEAESRLEAYRARRAGVVLPVDGSGGESVGGRLGIVR